MVEDLLLPAEALVRDFCQELDQLLQQARHRQQEIQARCRHLRRYLEEIDIRLLLPRESAYPAGERLQAQRQEGGRQLEAALAALAEAEECSRRLDLLRRQVEMSGLTLHDDAQSRSYDPWEQALCSQVLYGREQERAVLARDVHDGPAQVLSNSVLGLERCRRSETLEQAHELAAAALRDVRLGLQEVRRFIYDLRPSPLADELLGRQVERYINDMETSYQIEVEFRWAEPPQALSEEENLAIYRVIQEALQNARRHARARKIAVDAFVEEAVWVVRVSDNGAGFDPAVALLQEDHWGLRGMRERAQLIGAELGVDSRPGEGTTVLLRLSLQAADRHVRRP